MVEAMHVWGEDTWGISVPSSQCCSEPKTALKKKQSQKTQGK